MLSVTSKLAYIYKEEFEPFVSYKYIPTFTEALMFKLKESELAVH